jgi:hypothetical protein
LAALGVLWSWSDRTTLTGAFDDARELANEMFGLVAVTSYQGFTGAMRSYTEQLLLRLWMHMHGLMIGDMSSTIRRRLLVACARRQKTPTAVREANKHAIVPTRKTNHAPPNLPSFQQRRVSGTTTER